VDPASPRRNPPFKFTFNTVIYPAPDLPGQWVSHCLELDLISQGNDPQQALDMIADAIELMAEENIKHGRPPFTFRSAPPEAWELARGTEAAAERLIFIEAPIPGDGDITISPHIRRAS